MIDCLSNLGKDLHVVNSSKIIIMYPIITLDDFKSCVSSHPNWHYKVEPVRNKPIIVALEYFNVRKQKTGRKFSSFRNYNTLYEFVVGTNKRFRHLYEVIKGIELAKMRYDVDLVAANTENYNLQRKIILYRLIKAFTFVHKELTGQNCEYIIYSSCSDPKISYHVILPTVVGYHYQLDEFYSRTVDYLNKHYPLQEENLKYKNIIDASIYKSLQNFRILYCCKAGKDRYKKILTKFEYNDIVYRFVDEGDKNNFYNSLSSYVNKENVFLLPFERKQINIQESELDIDHAEIMALVQHIGNFTIREISGGLIILTKIGNYICPTCSSGAYKHVHENENPYLHVSKHGDVWFDCRRNPDGKKTHLGIVNTIDLSDINLDELDDEDEVVQEKELTPKSRVASEEKTSELTVSPTVDKSINKVKYNYRDVINRIFKDKI